MDTVQQFLVQQRQRARYGDIYIDSLCINQQDLEERISQVQLMGEIYSNAATVYVWLGESVCCTDYSLGHARELRTREWAWPLDSKHYESSFWLRLLGLDKAVLPSVGSFLKWTRTWIVQEFLLAKHVEILCGSEALDFKLLDEFFTDLFEATIKDMQKKNTAEFVNTHAHRLLRQKEKRKRKEEA